MILVTVGTQLPFPRLIEHLDELAPTIDRPVVAQIGKQSSPPKNIEWHESLAPPQFEALFSRAEIIVAHAGIGTILAAKKHRKPIIVVPREMKYREHRNDHQLATAAQLEREVGVYIARTKEDLETLLLCNSLEVPAQAVGASLTSLQKAVSAFVTSGRLREE